MIAWMAQKAALRQDMFLVADMPGGRARALAFEFCRRARRTCRYLALTRDTSEADLKQRREIANGALRFVDQPPIAAARAGDILILEGVENVERNVLPTLNNLLENREAALDDGTFLAAPQLRDVDTRSDAHGGAPADGRVTYASANFLVIAIGLPVPPYPGTPLDPPLRSRFAAHAVLPPAADDQVEALVRSFPRAERDDLARAVGATSMLRMLSERGGGGSAAAGGLQLSEPLPRCPHGASESVGALLAAFPRLSVLDALRRCYPIPDAAVSGGAPSTTAAVLPLDAMQCRAVHEALMMAKLTGDAAAAAATWAYRLIDTTTGEECTLTFEAERDAALAALLPTRRGDEGAKSRVGGTNGVLPPVGGMGAKLVKTELKERGAGSNELNKCVELSDFRRLLKEMRSMQGVVPEPEPAASPPPPPPAAAPVDVCSKDDGRVTISVPWGRGRRTGRASYADLTSSQSVLLSRVLQDRAIGVPSCIVGGQGIGKTVVARAFGATLGYGRTRTRVLFCFADMSARDLLQRRSTTPGGDTIWLDSPVVAAAKNGHLVLLDGVHRLPAGLLAAAIGRLLTDSECELPDGTRLLSTRAWEHKLRVCGGDATHLTRGGLFRCHPAFAVVAIAEPASTKSGHHRRSWLADDVLALFHFHPVVPLDDHEHRQMLTRAVTGSAQATIVIDTLLKCAHALREAIAADEVLAPLRLSTRRLVRITRHLRASSDGDAASASSQDDALRAALARELGATLSLLPRPTQRAVDDRLRAELRAAGLLDRTLLPSRDDDDNAPMGGGNTMGGGSQRGEEVLKAVKAQQLKELERAAVQLRTAQMWGHTNAHGEAKLDAEVHDLHRREEREAERASAARRKRAIECDGTSAGIHESAPHAVVERVHVRDGIVSIDGVHAAVRTPSVASLVPHVTFYAVPHHIDLLRELLRDWSLGHHLLLIGNQGVGKNKLADRLLELLRCEREYIQLHRDTTVQTLTLAPTVEDGHVLWRDSALVRAARLGRVLMVDEADKAPLEVVCVLKALAEDGELTLGDGRRLLAAQVEDESNDMKAGKDSGVEMEVDGGDNEESVIRIHPDFRMVVLANRPGYPFLGNDFFRECGDVFGASVVDALDLSSEIALLRSYAPSAAPEVLVDMCLLFAELRSLADGGILSYPYSTRELVKLAQHYERFPHDGLDGACANVFSFDAFDGRMRTTLAKVLARHGVDATVAFSRAPLTGGATFGIHDDALVGVAESHDGKQVLPNNFKTARHHNSGEFATEHKRMGNVGTKTYSDREDRSGKINRPTMGNWDGREHIGEGPWDGGSGGSGTAGIGGRAGSYRLDAGQELVMLSEEEKAALPAEYYEEARQLALNAYTHRLSELDLEPHDAAKWERLLRVVAAPVGRMRVALASRGARERERVWQRQQTSGELDDARIVDGVAGERNIYRRRAPDEAAAVGARARLPKRVKFVLDVSGSMYTFNRIDRRLDKLCELCVFLMEAFEGLDDQFEWSVVGHSGSGPEALRLIPWGRPPSTPKQKLKLVEELRAHAQYCNPGDATLDGTQRAIDDCLAAEADEHFVFVVSDADLERYGITPAAWDRILTADARCHAYAILLSQNETEAARIVAGITPGRALVCDKTDELASTFMSIFQHAVL